MQTSTPEAQRTAHAPIAIYSSKRGGAGIAANHPAPHQAKLLAPQQRTRGRQYVPSMPACQAQELARVWTLPRAFRETGIGAPSDMGDRMGVVLLGHPGGWCELVFHLICLLVSVAFWGSLMRAFVVALACIA
jgi:hypothetical protein